MNHRSEKKRMNGAPVPDASFAVPESLNGLADKGNLTHFLRGVGSLHSRLAKYELRGRWFKDERYGPLRNAAWIVRNSRHGQANNPLALAVVVAEVQKLVNAGEGLPDVVEAL